MPKPSEEQLAARGAARARKQALAAEEGHLRHEAAHQRWITEGKYLTREEAASSAPCRGCGLLVIDGLGSWPPLLKLTPEQREEYEAQNAAYAARHKDCRAHCWSVSGSRTTHCGACCPPLPLSRTQAGKIQSIMQSHHQSVKHLRRWALTLTCDHKQEVTRNVQDQAWSSGVVDCTVCGQARGVVEATPGEAYREDPSGRQVVAPRPTGPTAPTKRELEAQLGQAQRRIQELEQRLRAAGAEPGR